MKDVSLSFLGWEKPCCPKLNCSFKGMSKMRGFYYLIWDQSESSLKPLLPSHDGGSAMNCKYKSLQPIQFSRINEWGLGIKSLPQAMTSLCLMKAACCHACCWGIFLKKLGREREMREDVVERWVDWMLVRFREQHVRRIFEGLRRIWILHPSPLEGIHEVEFLI